jgi:hypothetical protein
MLLPDRIRLNWALGKLVEEIPLARDEHDQRVPLVGPQLRMKLFARITLGAM